MMGSQNSTGSHLDSRELPTEQELDEYPWKYVGYKEFVAYVASDADFFALRRFDRLHTRCLLTQQDQLVHLEEELDRLDAHLSKKNTKLTGANPPKIINHLDGKQTASAGITRDVNNRTIRDDVAERVELVLEIKSRLQDYVLRYMHLRQLFPASQKTVDNIKNWLEHNQGAIMDAETAFIQHKDELISTVPPKSKMRKWFEDHIIWRIGILRLRSSPRSPLSMRGNVTYTFNDKTIDLLGSVIVFVVAAVMLVAPL